MPIGPERTRPGIAPRQAPHRRFLPERGERIAPRLTALYADEPTTCRRDARQFVPILIHLALLVAVIQVFRVEGRAFRIVMGLAAAAVPVHYLLPLRWKKPLLIGVSLAGLLAVFGGVAAAWIIGLGALFIAVSRAPVAWWTRVGLLGGLTVVMGLARAGVVPSSLGPAAIPSTVWPVLASLFMFRMIVYLYELKHAERPEPLRDAFCYFALLPNLCFLLFPVVDYRTFTRGYHAVDIHQTLRRGLAMIVQGVVQLLLYRLVNEIGLIGAGQVDGPGTLARYVVFTYLLYLKVSGQFHVACGVLHLFGFHLPETHHRYLLATGFTDYWRRINIYWKDFMVRVVFHPIAFRLKRRPQAVSLTVATLAVFVTTWALHSYQSFWLKGSWGLSVPDALFWGILGLLVLVNVHQDARRPRRAPGRATPRDLALRALKTAGTFVTLCLLWSLWYSPSLSSWLDLLRRGLLGT